MRVLAGHDGSCPNSMKGVRRKSDSEWVVFPMWRASRGKSEEAPGSGYRFNVRVQNEENRPRRLVLHADWGAAARATMRSRDVGYMKHESAPDWTLVIPTLAGHTCTYSVTVQPGQTEIGLWPAYNTEDCRRFVSSLAGCPGVKTAVAGRSRKGREIYLIEINGPGCAQIIKPFVGAHILGRAGQREQVVVQARDHAYETAGSYCVEGMVRFLLSADPVAGYFLRRFRVAFLPMTNPDGVRDGMSRLSAPRGANLNCAAEQDDEAWRTIKRTLGRLRPNLYINVHNWTYKWCDGFMYDNEILMEHIRERMPSQGRFLKRWKLRSRADLLKAAGPAALRPENQTWKSYLGEAFNTEGVAFEFPWFGRNAADMRETGRTALLATLAGYLQMSGCAR